MNASGGGVSSDFSLFLRIWKTKCKLPLSRWTQSVYNTSFLFLSPLLVAEHLCSLQSFCVSLLGAEGFTGLSGVRLLGIWERDAVHGPSVLDLALEGAVGRLENIPSLHLPPPFSFFSCILPKKGLGVGC